MSRPRATLALLLAVACGAPSAPAPVARLPRPPAPSAPAPRNPDDLVAYRYSRDYPRSAAECAGFADGTVGMVQSRGLELRLIWRSSFPVTSWVCKVHGMCFVRDGEVQCVGREPPFDVVSKYEGNDLIEDPIGPVPADAKQASVYFDRSGCAVTQKGRVACWGANNELGQLGHGGPASMTPTEVAGITGAVEVSYSGRHACALTAKRELYCWGAMMGYLPAAAHGRSPCQMQFVPVQNAAPCPPNAAQDSSCSRAAWNASQDAGGDLVPILDGSCLSPAEADARTPVRIDVVAQPVAVSTFLDWTAVVTASGEVVTWSGAAVYGPRRVANAQGR